MSGKALNLKYTTRSTQYCANRIGTITEFVEVGYIHIPAYILWFCVIVVLTTGTDR